MVKQMVNRSPSTAHPEVFSASNMDIDIISVIYNQWHVQSYGYLVWRWAHVVRLVPNLKVIYYAMLFGQQLVIISPIQTYNVAATLIWT